MLLGESNDTNFKGGRRRRTAGCVTWTLVTIWKAVGCNRQNQYISTLSERTFKSSSLYHIQLHAEAVFVYLHWHRPPQMKRLHKNFEWWTSRLCQASAWESPAVRLIFPHLKRRRQTDCQVARKSANQVGLRQKTRTMIFKTRCVRLDLS